MPGAFTIPVQERGTMNEPTITIHSALFVYIQDNSGRFWAYDGRQYHRFLWNQQGLWYVRSQSYLPQYVVGRGMPLTLEQRLLLESEAARYQIVLPFFKNEEDATRFALTAQHEQFIFDRSFPAGYFTAEGDIKRRKKTRE
jgi:hypothetical protein